MLYYFIPLFILGGLLVLVGVLALLGRFRGGRYLRPIVATLSKVPWLRRQFAKLQRSMLERQNPELASAVRKLERAAGSNPSPQKAQQALSQLTATERRAYLEAVDEHGPEPANRQQRRLQQRMQQGGQQQRRPNTPKRGKRR